MKELTPAARNRSKQVFYGVQLKQQLGIYISSLSSTDELTFNIGVLINKMKSAGMKNDSIAETLQEFDQLTPL